MRGISGLVRIPGDEAGKYGHNNDLEIQREVPVLQVVEVIFDTFLDRRISSPPVDLGPARDPHFQGVTIVITGDFVQEFVDKVRALGPRADNTHVAFQNIDELWKLVKAGLPKERPKWGHTWIAFRGPACIAF